MIPRDPEPRNKMIKYMTEALIHEEKLSEWETNFIESIIDQFEKKGSLSDRQCEKLEQIYNIYH